MVYMCRYRSFKTSLTRAENRLILSIVYATGVALTEAIL